MAELSQDQTLGWLWSWFDTTGSSIPENQKNGSLTNKEIIHAAFEDFLRVKDKKR